MRVKPVKYSMGIDITETLTIGITQISLGKSVFQSGKNPIGGILSVVKIKVTQPTEVAADCFYSEAMGPEAFISRSIQIGQQSIRTVITA